MEFKMKDFVGVLLRGVKERYEEDEEEEAKLRGKERERGEALTFEL